MKSQPFQTAFTSMTLALVIFLSIWLIQATQAELADKASVPLQVRAEKESRENRRTDPRPDPFAETEEPHDLATASDPDRNPPPEQTTSIEMQDVRVRQVSEPQLTDRTSDSGPSSDAPELPQINIYTGGANPPAAQSDSAELNRIKEDLASESAAREKLQGKIDALTRQQSELKTSLEREQTTLSHTKQEKAAIAKKLDQSESELARLQGTTRELRSEAAEMKNSLKHVTSEFDSLKKRFEALQSKPRELAALPLPQTQSQLVLPPPAPGVSQPKDEFLPPIRKNGTSGVPQAPPSDSTQAPLIEADPLFRQSEADGDYPSMMCCETCTETGEPPARGIIPMLYRKWKRNHPGSCSDSCAENTASECCTDAGTCEQSAFHPKRLFRRLSDFVRKDDCSMTDCCEAECVPVPECKYQAHTGKGLIPDIARWIDARRRHGFFQKCSYEQY